jgi:Skp family chaperone for outer membrane proteins
MQSWVRRAFMVGASVCMISAAAMGARAVSSALAKPPVPPVIAVVDLKAVIDGLEERKDKQVQLDGRKAELKANLEKLKKELEDMQAALEQTPANQTQQRVVLRDRILRAAAQFKFEDKFAADLLDEMFGDLLRELHGKITEACKQVAQKNGYTMILASDEAAEVPRGGQNDVNRAIMLKQMLYVDDNHDITQEIITFMNNQHAAAKGKP